MKAVITGASSGIGAEFAKQLHRRGADVVLVARRRDRLEQVAGELNRVRTGSADIIVADLSAAPPASEDSSCVIDYLRLANLLRGAEVDMLINNAGIGSFGCYEELSLEAELAMVHLNVLAPIALTHAVLPQMKQRRAGVIVNVSSIAAFQPLPYMATYAATKCFEYSHSAALYEECRGYGVKVIAVCPGPTQTEFFGVARMPGSPTDIKRDRVEDVVSESLAAIDRGSRSIVTGFRSKMMALSSALLPVNLTTRLVGSALRKTLLLSQARK